MESRSDGQLPRRENYTFLENLGTGAFGNMCLAMDNQGDDVHKLLNDALPKSGRSRKPDPAEALLDLRLPGDDFGFKKFTDLLKEMSYSVNEEVTMKSSRNQRQYTKAEGCNGHRALIYIPWKFLNKQKQAYFDSIGNICSAFDKDVVLIVFSKSSIAPNGEILRIITQDWLAQVQKGKYVYWRHVEELLITYDSILKEQDPETKERKRKGLKKDLETMLEGLETG